MIENEKLTNAEKIFSLLQDYHNYESGYYCQSYNAYDLYSNLHNILRFSFLNDNKLYISKMSHHSQRRSNVYYSNIETLKSLVLPQIPSLVISLNASKKTNDDKNDKIFYNVCCNILSSIIKNISDNMKSGVWESFKMDYLVTGRGTLWINYNDLDQYKNSQDNSELSISNQFSIDYVSWKDFAYDPRNSWDSVSWVARRKLYSKKMFKQKYNVSDDKISGTLTLSQVYGEQAFITVENDVASYCEVWEFWDKPTKTCYEVSRQYNVATQSDDSRYLISKTHYPDADADFFFPTPQPPMLIYNGINLIPQSDVWSYIKELTELSVIAHKRSDLIETLHLRGYTDMTKAKVINEHSRTTSGDYLSGFKDDDAIVAIPGFVPNAQEPLIYYVDNTPRLQLLDFLQKEYQFLIDRIYSLTGISEQMRNVTSQEDDETATSVRMKTKFGSRRLKEHQQKLITYWTQLLKILLHRIAQTIDVKILKKDFSYQFRDTVKKDLQELIFERTDLENQLKQLQFNPQAPNNSVQQPSFLQGLGGRPTQPPAIEEQPAPMPQDMQTQPQNMQTQPQDMQTQPQDMQTQPQDMQTQPQDMQTQPQDMQGGLGYPTPNQTPNQTPNGDNNAPAPAQQEQKDPQQDIQDKLDEVEQKIEQLHAEITWDRIVNFLHKDKLVSFLVSCHLDDLENKIIADEKKNSDLEYMNTIIGIVNQIIANVANNPKFCDIYTSIFSLSLDNFDQTKSQRDSIDDFIKQIKMFAEELLNKPPSPPPPSPDDQKKMAEAEEIKMKTQLLQAQIAEINAKIQAMQQQSPEDTAAGVPDNKMQEIQLQHQNDMELQQAKIQADAAKYQDKMESDRQLLQMKIQADKERYQEKIKSDYLEGNLNNPGEPSQI